ncbi:MAG: PAS domain S-box protein [Pseudomonadales bacterium]|nr:PAS domain S-box protein [Pseudomonadales bacterium]
MNYELTSHNSFAALLDAAVDSIIVSDSTGIMLVVNPAATKLFGYQKKEIMGKNIKMLMPEKDNLHHDGYMKNYLETGQRKIIGLGRETTGVKKDHSVFPMYLSVGHIKNSDGDNFVGIIHDLTTRQQQQRQLEQHEIEIRKLQEKLAHVARISTLGEMVTGIAHEINQPLTAISTYAQGSIRMLNSKAADTTELLAAQQKITGQAERAAQVIGKIRNFAKKTNIKHQPQNCNALISEVASLAEVHAKELGVTLQLQLSEHPDLLVMVDGIQVQQVALNLINNAIESMTNAQDQKQVIIRTTKLDENTAEISVHDNGEGLAEALEEQMFDAFFTTKSAGLGMGLAICQSIIASHQGIIRFRRNPDKGCTFSFTLPTAVGITL